MRARTAVGSRNRSAFRTTASCRNDPTQMGVEVAPSRLAKHDDAPSREHEGSDGGEDEEDEDASAQ